MTRRRPPRDPTATIRQQRCRKRLERHERCASVTIGPDVVTVMMDVGLVREHELEDRQRLAAASEAALKAWAEDRRTFIERVTRDNGNRKPDV